MYPAGDVGGCIKLYKPTFLTSCHRLLDYWWRGLQQEWLVLAFRRVKLRQCMRDGVMILPPHDFARKGQLLLSRIFITLDPLQIGPELDLW